MNRQENDVQYRLIVVKRSHYGVSIVSAWLGVCLCFLQRQVRWILKSSRGVTSVELSLVFSCLDLLVYVELLKQLECFVDWASEKAAVVIFESI